MRTGDLDYPLPPDAIAQHPSEPRDAARLLVGPGVAVAPGAPPTHLHVRDLPSVLARGDLVVVNSTRVLPGRVRVRRDGGGSGEVLLLEEAADGTWEALCRPSRRLRPGARLRAVAGDLAFEVRDALGDGRWALRATTGAGVPLDPAALATVLEEAGEMPLPPYITEPLVDPERYQTVFSERPASAAAPTAGLHLTEATLGALRRAGVGVASVELVVGLDTFRPLTCERVEDHPIHREAYDVPERTWRAVQATRAGGGRVVAVGTTTVRALESRAAGLGGSGRTSLFITPGFTFAVVDLLVTNFHLPRSSLLALVEAFAGPGWRGLYAAALDAGYRFLSFGDAMVLARGSLVAGHDRCPPEGGAGR